MESTIVDGTGGGTGCGTAGGIGGLGPAGGSMIVDDICDTSVSMVTTSASARGHRAAAISLTTSAARPSAVPNVVAARRAFRSALTKLHAALGIVPSTPADAPAAAAAT